MNQQKKIINSFIHMISLQNQKNIEDRKNFVKALEELDKLNKDNLAYEKNVAKLIKDISQFSKQETNKFDSLREELLLEINSLKKKNEALEEKISEYETQNLNTQIQKKQKNILFIGASQLVQKKVLKVLDQTAYEVTFVDTVEEAIELSGTVSFDFFFTDVENMSEKLISLLS